MTRHFIAAVLLALAMPAHAQDKPAAEPGPGQEPEPAIIEDIMTCLAEGLTPQWYKTWFVVRETRRNDTGSARQYEATFFVSNSPGDDKGERLSPCGPEKIIEGVGKLNAYLPENQQRWTSATFTFHRDGRYAANYDYSVAKPAPRPAAKGAPKKDAKK
jgi:hypothetical protein